MDDETYFNDVSMVLDTWSQLKRNVKNYQETFGMTLFIRYV